MRAARYAVTLCCLLAPVWSAAQAQVEHLWAGFETVAEVGKWETLDAQFERSAKFATQGEYSARLRFHRYDGAEGEEQWPRVTAFAECGLYPKDWSDWAAVALDLTTDASEGATVSLEIRDTRGKNGWFASYSLQRGTAMHITVALKGVGGKIDLSHIEEVLIFKGRPQSDLDVYVDNVRLISQAVFDMQSALDAAAAAFDCLWTRDGAAADVAEELAGLRQAASAPGLSGDDAQKLMARARELVGTIEERRIRPLKAFDFGPAGSPVREGFVSVSAATVYRAETGYGWRSGEGLRELSKPAEREWQMSDYRGAEVPPVVYLNDLTQDLVGGVEPAVFTVDVPAGDYAVWILAGFPSGYAPVVNNFAIEGGAGWQRVGLPQEHMFESQFMPARADGDRLYVSFSPETGFVVNALAVFPLEEMRRARKEFAGPIDNEVFLAPPEVWADWRLMDAPHETSDPPPTDEEGSRGYVVFSRPYVHNVHPTSRPQPGERRRELQTFATPGEYEPFTASIWALRSLDAVSAEVTALRGPGDSNIPASRIDIRQVRSWPVRTQYSAWGTYKIVPEILDPVGPSDMAAGEARRFWVTVHVPEDAVPGRYRGRMTIRPGNAPSSSVDLSLEVLPFRLMSDPTKGFGNYYRSPLNRINANTPPHVAAAIRRRAEAEARDMQEHGMTTMQMGGISATKTGEGWEAAVNLDERIEFLSRFGLWRDDQGVMMNAFFVGSVYHDLMGVSFSKHLVGAEPPPQEYYDIVTQLIEQVEKVRLERGWPDFYYYPIDEASAEAIPVLAGTLAAIKRVPTAKTYATQVFELAHNRPLDDVLDVWCSAWFCSDLEAVEAMRQKGRIFWCYPNFVACSRAVPNSARMTYGFGLWRMGYSCLIPWHYQAPASGSNPFCDFDGSYGDWCLAYPGPDGPIPTQRWEAIREGIDDGRYIYTLEARIADAKQKGTTGGAVTAGEALLAEIREAVPVQSKYEQAGPWRGAEYDSYRRRLAEAIVALR